MAHPRVIRMASLRLHPIPFPVEVYSIIFRHITISNLTTLCRVSKTFQNEAARILYYSVDVTHINDGERLMSWCNAIAESPPRALLVHALKLPVYFETPRSQSTLSTSLPVQQAIGRALRAFINLDELSVRGPHASDSIDQSPSLLPSTFDGCTFSLSALSGDLPGFTPEEVWKLLFQHSNISYWAASHSFQTSMASIPHGVLPNVSDVVLVRPKMLKYLVGRPIKRLVWLFQSFRHTRNEGMEAIVPLELFNHTLTDIHYTYVGQQDSGWAYEDIISCIATYVPNLKSLVIGSFLREKLPHNTVMKNLTEAVSGFQQLETLQLDIDRILIHPSNNKNPAAADTLHDTALWLGYSPTECCKVATLFMASCPALRHVSFRLGVEAGEGVCCFVRSEDHQAKLEGFDTVDTTSWWMR